MNDIIEIYKEIEDLIVNMLMEYYDEKPCAKFVDTRPVTLINEIEWRLNRIKDKIGELPVKVGENQPEGSLRAI